MISCLKCKKEFEKPLEIDGRWYCPYCKADMFLTKDTDFEITLENHKLFVLSEEKFNADYLVNEKSLKDVQRKEALKQAIHLCRRSAQLKNPYALANLGYYYEQGYIGEYFSEKTRAKAACACYDAIFSSLKLPQTRIFGPKGRDIGSSLEKLKKSVAVNFLNVLKKYPIPEYNETKKILCEYLKVNYEDYIYSNYEQKTDLTSQEYFNKFVTKLCNLKIDDQVPLLGFFKMGGYDDWMKIPKDVYKQLHRAVNRKNITLLAKVSNFGGYSNFTCNSIERFLKDNDMQFYICVVNNNVDQKLISSKKTNKALLDNEGEIIDSYIAYLEVSRLKYLVVYADEFIYNNDMSKKVVISDYKEVYENLLDYYQKENFNDRL